jgi:aspartate aminotransferase
MELSKKHLGISESLTLAISARAKEMKADGEDVIGFGAGEPDFKTPEFINDAAREALNKGMTKYTPVSGIRELKEAICHKLASENNLKYIADQIIISNGAKHSIYNALQVLLNPGDEVIITVPYWVSYSEMVKMAGGIPVFVQTDQDFNIEISHLKKALTNKTKALILNSPNNPTGCVLDRADLESIAELALNRGFYIISDEIYEKIIYDGIKHISIASLGDEIKEQTIVINGMSKTYAMTGWRIGYAAGNKEIIKIMVNLQSHSTSNPNSIAQYASIAALNSSESEMAVEQMVREFDLRRQYIVREINAIKGLSSSLPHGSFYIFLNISSFFGKNGIIDSLSFTEKLLNEEKVAVVPGVAFGIDNFVRLSYATSMDNIERGLKRLKRFAANVL